MKFRSVEVSLKRFYRPLKYLNLEHIGFQNISIKTNQQKNDQVGSIFKFDCRDDVFKDFLTFNKRLKEKKKLEKLNGFDFF